MKALEYVAVLACGAVPLVGCTADPGQSAMPSPNSAVSMSSAPSSTATDAAVPDGEFQPIPGTRVALEIPAGLRLDPTLPGLARPNSRTSIVVLDELRAPGTTPDQVLDDMDRSFRDTTRSARTGLDLGAPQRQQVAGRPGLVVTGTQSQAGQTYQNALAVTVTEDSTVLMTGTVEVGDPLSINAVTATLVRAHLTADRAPHDFGFSIEPAAGYQQVPSSALMYTLGGASGRDTPRFLASPSTGPTSIPADQRRSTAEQRYQHLPGNPAPRAVTETSVAGLPAWEVTGDSASTLVYAVMVFPATGYVLLSGSQPKGTPDQTSAFRQMAHSLRVDG